MERATEHSLPNASPTKASTGRGVLFAMPSPQSGENRKTDSDKADANSKSDDHPSAGSSQSGFTPADFSMPFADIVSACVSGWGAAMPTAAPPRGEDGPMIAESSAGGSREITRHNAWPPPSGPVSRDGPPVASATRNGCRQPGSAAGGIKIKIARWRCCRSPGRKHNHCPACAGQRPAVPSAANSSSRR